VHGDYNTQEIFSKKLVREGFKTTIPSFLDEVIL